jgi:hypothetical protein
LFDFFGERETFFDELSLFDDTWHESEELPPFFDPSDTAAAIDGFDVVPVGEGVVVSDPAFLGDAASSLMGILEPDKMKTSSVNI